MSEKSYGQIAYESHRADYPWDRAMPSTREIYDVIADAVVVEYERRNPKPILPSAEAIAEAFCDAIPGKKWADCTVVVEYVSQGTAKTHAEVLASGNCALLAAPPGRKWDNALGLCVPDESAPKPLRHDGNKLLSWNVKGYQDVEKEPETQAQYEERLLRALRSFG